MVFWIKWFDIGFKFKIKIKHYDDGLYRVRLFFYFNCTFVFSVARLFIMINNVKNIMISPLVYIYSTLAKQRYNNHSNNPLSSFCSYNNIIICTKWRVPLPTYCGYRLPPYNNVCSLHALDDTAAQVSLWTCLHIIMIKWYVIGCHA